MTIIRSIIGVIGLAVLCAAVGSAGNGNAGDWPWKRPEAIFYQEVRAKSKLDLAVLGETITQRINYRAQFRWRPLEERNENHVFTLEILQLIVSITTGNDSIRYDSNAKVQSSEIFNRLKGRLYEFTLNSNLEILKTQKTAKQLSSDDVQKEMVLEPYFNDDTFHQAATLAFLAFPAQRPVMGGNWVNSTGSGFIDLGPAGRYAVKYTYTSQGPDKQGRDGISIKSALSLSPNEKDRLPYKITDVELLTKERTGRMYFDKAKGRLIQASLNTKLDGKLIISIGGVRAENSLVFEEEVESITSDEPIATKD